MKKLIIVFFLILITISTSFTVSGETPSNPEIRPEHFVARFSVSTDGRPHALYHFRTNAVQTPVFLVQGLPSLSSTRVPHPASGFRVSNALQIVGVGGASTSAGFIILGTSSHGELDWGARVVTADTPMTLEAGFTVRYGFSLNATGNQLTHALVTANETVDITIRHNNLPISMLFVYQGDGLWRMVASIQNTSVISTIVRQDDAWFAIARREPDESVPPVAVAHDRTAWVGQPVMWYDGVSGHWGISTENQIPPLGQIIDTHIEEHGTYIEVSADGLIFDKVGTIEQTFEVRDSHSVAANMPYDTTMTEVTRRVFVASLYAPKLKIVFSEGSTTTVGQPIEEGTMYNPSAAETASGGEDGWTNQALDIFVDASNIAGSFSTILQGNAEDLVRDFGNSAIYKGYSTQSFGENGTPITGFLGTQILEQPKLSAIASSVVKIDHGAPKAAAVYHGGFHFECDSTDGLSGISEVVSPTQIAFANPDILEAPVEGWEPLEGHSMTKSGFYSVWVRATDKAGNQHTDVVSHRMYVGGEVTISKNTNEGALLHEQDCDKAGTMDRTCCTSTFGDTGEVLALEEGSTFQYELKLTNIATVGNAEGSFEDYLPKGVKVQDGSSASASASRDAIANVMSTPITDDSSNVVGYLIEGDYNNLAPDETITVTIPVEILDYDPDADNILSNQASTEWKIGSEQTEIEATNYSNYANHEVVAVGVKTVFTKVGADALKSGLSGAEFALYRWNGNQSPSDDDLAYLVNTNELESNNWLRVKKDGVAAESLTDVFISSTSVPLGEVDLGNLEEGYYTLIETKAPSGYELPVGQWLLTIDPNKKDSGVGEWKIELVGKSQTLMPPAAIRDEGDVSPSYRIINARPFAIGLSGLSGTRGLLLLGFVLMALAGNAFIVYSFKQKERVDKEENIRK